MAEVAESGPVESHAKHVVYCGGWFSLLSFSFFLCDAIRAPILIAFLVLVCTLPAEVWGLLHFFIVCVIEGKCWEYSG